jgi:hypothetical protein
MNTQQKGKRRTKKEDLFELEKQKPKEGHKGAKEQIMF